jgi:hypothetical protein
VSCWFCLLILLWSWNLSSICENCVVHWHVVIRDHLNPATFIAHSFPSFWMALADPDRIARMRRILVGFSTSFLRLIYETGQILGWDRHTLTPYLLWPYWMGDSRCFRKPLSSSCKWTSGSVVAPVQLQSLYWSIGGILNCKDWYHEEIHLQ